MEIEGDMELCPEFDGVFHRDKKQYLTGARRTTGMPHSRISGLVRHMVRAARSFGITDLWGGLTPVGMQDADAGHGTVSSAGCISNSRLETGS